MKVNLIYIGKDSNNSNSVVEIVAEKNGDIIEATIRYIVTKLNDMYYNLMGDIVPTVDVINDSNTDMIEITSRDLPEEHKWFLGKEELRDGRS